MITIDYIMSLLDWNNPIEKQTEGLVLAEKINDIYYFLQPENIKYNKNVWENCAKILAKKSDSELEKHLIKLFEWLQDMTWPGADRILHRLEQYDNNEHFSAAYYECISRAESTGDYVWLDNLNSINFK